MKKYYAILFIIFSVLNATQINVVGNAYLEGQQDHSSIRVKCTAVSPSAVTDSTTTDSDGRYAIALEIGIYHVEYSKDNYLPHYVSNLYLTEDVTLSDITLQSGTIVEISDTLSGILTTDHIYRVTGDLTVPQDSTLTINPGVRIMFAGDYDLNCYGPITAIGTEQDSIYFTSAMSPPAAGDWGGVYIYYNDYDSTNLANQFDYCVFSYGKGNTAQLEISSSLVSINHTSFRNSSRGDLYISYSYGNVYNSNFSGGSNNYWNINNNHSEVYYRDLLLTNFDDAFYIRGSGSNVELINSTFTNGNRRALYTDGSATATVDSCLFNNIENDWTVQFHDNSLIDFQNNVLENIYAWNAIGVWSSAHVNILDNYIEGRLYYTDYDNNSHNQSTPPQIAYNIIEKDPDDCCYEGLDMRYNSRLVEAHHNTIVGFGLTSGHRGIFLRDNDSLSIHSNIIYGNGIGINSNNNGYLDISYNSFYANNNLIQEDDFPQGFGDVIATNANGDPADIYSNIFMDPQFANYFDYELMVSSPAINAGSPDYLDADGTVSDIGAKPFYFPFLIDHTPILATSDTVGPYAVNATITPLLSQSIISKLFYKVTPSGFYDDDWGNTALEFDGNSSGDRVEIPHNSSYYFGSTITIEAWIKPNSTGNSYILSNRANNGTEGFLLTYDSWDRRIRWHIWTNTSSNSWDGNTQLNVGQWYHITATYDGNVAKLYINGALDGNWDWQNSGTINYSPDGLTIGYRRHYGQEFNGAIDEVRVWNTVRTSGEISSNMNRELFGTEAGLIGYWRFNEEPSSSATDYSNNQNNGNIINASYSDSAPNLLPAEGFTESDWTTVTMTNTSNDVYSGNISGQSLFSRIDYFIEITDGSDTLTSPYYFPYEYHRFNISLFESVVDMDAVSQNDGTVALTWGTPVPIGSPLLGYNLYYDTDPDVEITSENQLSSFFSGENNFTHEGLEEGTTYYYKITGIFDDGNSSELVIADEVSALSDNSTLLYANGLVQVENATDHSGVKIVFRPETSSGVMDSVLTDATGFFDIVLPISIYSVDITKEGCVPVRLTSVFLSNNYDFGTIQLIAREVQEISGSISGTLSSNKYYLVTGNLSISSNDTLWIEPGVIIAFDGYLRIEARGPIIAIGTEEDSILFTSHASQPGPGDWEYINISNNAHGSRFDYCVFENGDGWSEWVASGVVRIDHVSDVKFDHCRFSHNRRGAIAFYGSYRNYMVQNSIFSFNYQDQNQDGGILNIRLWSQGGDVLITNNIFYQNYGNDIASYDCIDLTISNNSFFSDHNNYDNQAMYMRRIKPLIVTGNILSGKSYIGIHHDCFGLIKNNFIQHNAHYTNGIYVRQSTMEIISNEIENCRDGIYYQNSRNFTENDSYEHKISYNTFYDMYESSLEIRDNSHDMEISNNTLVNADQDNNNGSDGAAVYLENNSGDIFAHSNVITDSRYASYINNNTGSIDFNNNAFWNNENLLSGSGYPTDMGTVNNENVNGDPSDIYSNIFLDPQFVEVDSNHYSLLGTSPLIDAGYFFYTDPDGSILDIGAHYYDHGNPHNLVIIDGDDQELTLEWSAVNRDSLTGYNVYSKLATETDFTFNLLTTDTTASVSNLTNNLDYKFVVTSVYPNSESIISVSVTGRPGLAEIAFSPSHLIQSTSAGDSSFIHFQILNNGVKDLFYVLEEDSLGHFLTGYYYNNSDWDNFSELLAVRDDDMINFNWDDASQLPPGVPSDNFHIRWTGSVNFPASGDYYFEYCIDDNIRMSVDGNWIIWTGGCCWCGNNQYIEQGVHEIVIDFIEYGGGAYTYLKWQPPGENLDWFGGSSLLESNMFSNTSGTVPTSSSVDVEVTIPPSNVGTATGMIPFVTNDKSDPYVELPLLLMTDYTFIPALQFSPAEESGDPFYFVMNDGNIDGNDFQAGDEIAIFDGDYCVGAGIFNNNYPFVIKSYGFNESNSYTVRIWDNSQYRYGTGEITDFIRGNGLFAANGFNEGSINATVYSINNIDITANQFSLVSLNMFPQDQDAGAVFGNIEGLKIVYDDHGGAYIPDYSINTIGSVNITEGYYLFFDSTNADFNYPGLSVENSDWPLIIQANRWNYISYLPQTVADTSIFSSIRESIDIIVSDDGGSWIPSLNVNTIGNFEPGKGYKVFLSGNTDLNFTYPAATRALSKILANEIPTVKHFEYVRTGLPYTVVIQSADFEGRRLQSGDEIGIFDGELCVGAGVFTDEWPLSVTAWASHENVDIQGYTKNKSIELRLYSAKYETYYPLFTEFRSSKETRFEGANYSVVQRASTGGNVLPTSYALGNNYPNPFNPTTIIPYQLPEDTRIRITVYNMLGQEVAILLDEFQLANFYRVNWKGKDDLGRPVPSGVYIYRLETPEYHKSKKLLLLK